MCARSSESRLDWTSIGPRHPKASWLDALGGQHPEHIVIRNDQELRRVGERDVVGEHLRFHVPVHADKRQILRLVIDLPGDAPLLCRKRESAVRFELEGRHRQLLDRTSRWTLGFLRGPENAFSSLSWTPFFSHEGS